MIPRPILKRILLTRAISSHTMKQSLSSSTRRLKTPSLDFSDYQLSLGNLPPIAIIEVLSQQTKLGSKIMILLMSRKSSNRSTTSQNDSVEQFLRDGGTSPTEKSTIRDSQKMSRRLATKSPRLLSQLTALRQHTLIVLKNILLMTTRYPLKLPMRLQRIQPCGFRGCRGKLAPRSISNVHCVT